MTQADELALLCRNRGLCLYFNQELDDSIVWMAKALELQQLPELRKRFLEYGQKQREAVARNLLIRKMSEDGRLDINSYALNEGKYTESLIENSMLVSETKVVNANSSALADGDEAMLALMKKEYNQPMPPKGAIYMP